MATDQDFAGQGQDSNGGAGVRNLSVCNIILLFCRSLMCGKLQDLSPSAGCCIAQLLLLSSTLTFQVAILLAAAGERFAIA